MPSEPTASHRIEPLHDGWTLSAVDGAGIPASVAGRRIPAVVPGCVHTDLLAAGLIPDPYLDDNERQLSWIGMADWRYERALEWRDDGADRVDLICEGLDTVAEVTLNDAVLGRTANMHRSYRFDARAALRRGENRLSITFSSAVRHAEAVRDRLGPLPNAYPTPFNFVRKMACNFGWDWGPSLVTAGIWRPIALHAWSTARLAQIRPLVRVEAGAGRIQVLVDVEPAARPAEALVVAAQIRADSDLEQPATHVSPDPQAAAPTGWRATAELAADGTAVLELEIDAPDLWWPHGHGEQPLYPLDVTLHRAGAPDDAPPLDRWSRRIGFRDLRLDTAQDEHGSAFTIVVNDVPLFARGANWIPDDCFPSRIGRERYRQRIEQAREANIDLLRVWGGGIYESRDFYELCDELGVLVWQDFLFACAAYPEEAPLRDEVEAEAREAVARLTPHPSLILWNGNNENLWGWADWGWQEDIDDRTWGEGYYLEILPRIVAELDPTRPYWPGSPWSGAPERHPNDPAHGPMHIWDVWNARDYTSYRDYVPRFAAEFGFQGPPTWATLRRAISDDPLTPDSPGMAHHQKAAGGSDKILRALKQHFGAPAGFDDWHYLAQVNQARAIALGVEHFRSHRGVCMGAAVWQLNDCWPVTSWAAIDGDGRRKPLWYALRRAYAPRLLTIQPRDSALAAVAVNELAEEWTAELVAARRGFDGSAIAEHRAELHCPPRSAVEIALPASVAAAGDASRELLITSAEGAQRALWFFAPDRALRYPRADFDAEAAIVAGGFAVTVRARSLLRDLALLADRAHPEAEVDDMLVTLLPGEAVTFTVTAPAPIRADAVLRPPALRCVDDILRRT